MQQKRKRNVKRLLLKCFWITHKYIYKTIQLERYAKNWYPDNYLEELHKYDMIIVSMILSIKKYSPLSYLTTKKIPKPNIY